MACSTEWDARQAAVPVLMGASAQKFPIKQVPGLALNCTCDAGSPLPFCENETTRPRIIAGV